MRIAVDFDGTIVENEYPNIGEPMLFAFETMKKLQEMGHQIILWTYRSGHSLDEAVEFCRQHGIEFYAVNHSFPEEEKEFPNIVHKRSRKIEADIFIDDRNIGGFIGWGEVWHMIHPDSGPQDIQYVDEKAHRNYPRKSLFRRIFGK